VWQSQAVDAPRISLEYVRHVASDFDRRRRLRAVPAYVIWILTCGWFCLIGKQFLHTKPLGLAGLVCFGLFALYCIYRMHRHVAAESSPADAGVLDTLRYQRRQLERQRDFRRGSWRWQFWGVLPGYALTLASMYFENDPVPWVYMGFVVLVLILGLGLQAWSGERGARRSQREIDALDSLAGDL
jgi:hypothetical protein